MLRLRELQELSGPDTQVLPLIASNCLSLPLIASKELSGPDTQVLMTTDDL